MTGEVRGMRGVGGVAGKGCGCVCAWVRFVGGLMGVSVAGKGWGCVCVCVRWQGDWRGGQ